MGEAKGFGDAHGYYSTEHVLSWRGQYCEIWLQRVVRWALILLLLQPQDHQRPCNNGYMTCIWQGTSHVWQRDTGTVFFPLRHVTGLNRSLYLVSPPPRMRSSGLRCVYHSFLSSRSLFVKSRHVWMHKPPSVSWDHTRASRRARQVSATKALLISTLMTAHPLI